MAALETAPGASAGELATTSGVGVSAKTSRADGGKTIAVGALDGADGPLDRAGADARAAISSAGASGRRGGSACAAAEVSAGAPRCSGGASSAGGVDGAGA